MATGFLTVFTKIIIERCMEYPEHYKFDIDTIRKMFNFHK